MVFEYFKMTSTRHAVQAGTIPPSQFLTEGFCSMPGATTVSSSW